MYNAFKEAVELTREIENGDTDETIGWTFYDDTQTAILNWEADNWKEE